MVRPREFETVYLLSCRVNHIVWSFYSISFFVCLCKTAFYSKKIRMLNVNKHFKLIIYVEGVKSLLLGCYLHCSAAHTLSDTRPVLASVNNPKSVISIVSPVYQLVTFTFFPSLSHFFKNWIRSFVSMF